MAAKKIAILTGFACFFENYREDIDINKQEPLIETDGLAGTIALSKALLNLDKVVTVLMDSHSEHYMKEVNDEL